ncbi:MAG: rod shape-determining protein MreD [Candidatus Omnitrophica bacterium]|nr:rod shape-determining protein MreD [Candidatus Omnitrophota bacterium]
MRILNFLLTITGFGILEITFLNYFKLFLVKPDLLLLGVISVSLFLDLKSVLVFAILSGIFKDVYSLGQFGIHTILFCLWGFTMVELSRKISLDDNWMRLLVVLIVALLDNIILGLSRVYAGSVIPLGIFLRTVFLSSIYSTLFFPAVFQLIKRIPLNSR